VYLVIHVPRFRKPYTHNPYAVLYLNETPVTLYYLSRRLEQKGVKMLYKLSGKYRDFNYVASNSTIITACGENPWESSRYHLIKEKYLSPVPVPEHLVSLNFPYRLHWINEVNWCTKVLKTFLLMKRDSTLLEEYRRISVVVGKLRKQLFFLFKVENFKPRLASTKHFYLPYRRKLDTGFKPQGAIVSVWPIVLENKIFFKIKKGSKLEKARKVAEKYLKYLKNMQTALNQVTLL